MSSARVVGPAPAPCGSGPAAATGFRSDGAADRFMRRILGVTAIRRGAGRDAHQAFRVSVLISAVRCLVTYALIPVVVPLLSLAGWVAAPVGLAMCVVAVVNGIVSVRRFWHADHPQRWMYTAFMGVVFVILAAALYSDLTRLGALL